MNKKSLFFTTGLIFFPSSKVEQDDKAHPEASEAPEDAPRATVYTSEVDPFLAAMKSQKFPFTQNPFGKGEGRVQVLE